MHGALYKWCIKAIFQALLSVPAEYSIQAAEIANTLLDTFWTNKTNTKVSPNPILQQY